MSYTTLAASDFVVSSDSVTAPAWSSNQPVLTTFFTASAIPSTTITQGAFYLNVYQTASNANGASIQFAIAYGNQKGSGSQWYNSLVPGYSPSLTTYKQYSTLVYGPEISGSQGFNFGGQASNALDIFALNIDRNRYKMSLLPGTFNLTLSGSGNDRITLCDNSNNVSTVTYLDCGRVFDLVSGSYGSATNATPPGGIAPGYTASGSYGFYLPDIGTIILNPSALALSFATGGISLPLDRNNYGASGYTLNASASYTSTNNTLLFQAISQSAILPIASSNRFPGFQLNSQETVSSDYVFVRIPNSAYNYSTNPTFVTGSGSGAVLYSTMIYSPQTYITTVGLYNNNNQLLAVAKMSTPLVKDFTKEALIRVKLDW
jgi:hypothetical protein